MAFDPSSITVFRFTAVRYDTATAVAQFDYELAGVGEPYRFTETVSFTAGYAAPDLDADASLRLERVLVLLGATLGLSYYKLAAPPVYELAVPGVRGEVLDYLNELVTWGLAEFAYRNELPGLLTPRFVGTEPVPEELAPLTVTGTPLVPIGGGKDSAVTVESLREAGLDPVQFSVNPNAIHGQVAEASGLPLVTARRRLDARLFDLNAQGALNGHVPVTAMNTLIAVAQAIRLGLGPVVMSNEASASDPTLHWDTPQGRVPVNHQWSKSLDGERVLNRALAGQAGLQNAAFSLLRPFSELRIARGYARTSAYDDVIVSCNRAFRLQGAEPSWCGDCDKCRFVFLILAPWMEPERLVRIVGRDLFADESQLPGFRALLGLADHKPFECVGEEAEASIAVSLLARDPRWAEAPIIRALVAEAPALAVGDAALEARVLGEAEAPPLPEPYEDARRALV